MPVMARSRQVSLQGQILAMMKDATKIYIVEEVINPIQ